MPIKRKPSELREIRARFRTALAEAGTSMVAWAAANEWTTAHVTLTLRGKRESERVMSAVREFTDAQEAKMRERLTETAAVA
jgi:uncharacterized protein (DUF2141 family)